MGKTSTIKFSDSLGLSKKQVSQSGRVHLQKEVGEKRTDGDDTKSNGPPPIDKGGRMKPIEQHVSHIQDPQDQHHEHHAQDHSQHGSPINTASISKSYKFIFVLVTLFLLFL